MRLARLSTSEGPIRGTYDDGTVQTDDGTYQIGLDGELLPPCRPSAVYCVGRNFAETTSQMDAERPDEPNFFIKPPASLLAHDEPIRYPEFTDELTFAGELAAVIDKRCRNLDPDDVSEAVRGYTILNDVDALDQESLTARKAFDGSAPLGPWIETDVDPSSIDISIDVNGDRTQESSTDLMLFAPRELVSFLSKRFTFRPGDVVAFGGPAKPSIVAPGDEIEITYEGVGTLRNRIVAKEGTRRQE